MWKAGLRRLSGESAAAKNTDRPRRAKSLAVPRDGVGRASDRGVLYQDTLSSYDGKLIPAIYNYWNSHARLDSDRLPLPKRDRTEAILQRVVAHGPDAFEDVMRAVRAFARRGEREK